MRGVLTIDHHGKMSIRKASRRNDKINFGLRIGYYGECISEDCQKLNE